MTNSSRRQFLLAGLGFGTAIHALYGTAIHGDASCHAP